MTHVLINFSGHPLCDDAKITLSNRYERIIDTKPMHFDFLEQVEPQLENIVKDIPDIADSNCSITLIPPGQATLSILLTSYIHGVIGHFPRLCYLELGKEGLYLPRAEFEISTHDVRMAGRTFRVDSF